MFRRQFVAGSAASAALVAGRAAQAQDPRLDAHVNALKAQLTDPATLEYRGRKVAEDISLALQGALLVRHGHPAVAEAFLVSRLEIGRAHV